MFGDILPVALGLPDELPALALGGVVLPGTVAERNRIPSLVLIMDKLNKKNNPENNEIPDINEHASDNEE